MNNVYYKMSNNKPSISPNRQSPNINANDFDLGSKKTGLDGNTWKVVEDINGRHLWVMSRDKSYLSRSKTKTKSKKSNQLSRSKKQKSKTKSKGERKSPKESATLYKVGTKKNGLDGNKWIITETANGIKRWKMHKKVQKALVKI